MCIYHSNYIEAVTAVHKLAPNVPDYDNGFVEHFLCENSNSKCWFGTCDQCTGISIEKLTAFVVFFGKKPLNSPARWKVWKKNIVTKRIEKHQEEGLLSDLLVHIVTLSSKFLTHSFVKTQQSDTFNSYDRARALDTEIDNEAVLQIDFAENYVCESQDEVQSAHWNQRQLSLFTSALYHNGHIHSNVFVSDNLTHTKETIIPYLFKLLTNMPNSVKYLKIWSDGPSSFLNLLFSI